MFQSLFFWMLLSKLGIDTYSTMFTEPSFNPYFSGCFSLRSIDTGLKGEVIKFQSLFFWMLLSKDASAMPSEMACESFNPYFSGCFSLTCRYRSVFSFSMAFQSLFFWMLLSNSGNTSQLSCFTSLFQSLFFWMLLSNDNHFRSSPDILVVSILIFLDASL